MRAYRKVRRAEAENETRARIVEALISLHGEVGPARTTVSAVAERAGVERLTVYRHFPDEPSMFRACSALWAERNPAPPVPQLTHADPLAGCRRTLTQLYAWYRSNARMLNNVITDAEVLAAVRDEFAAIKAYLNEVATAMDRQWPQRNARRFATLRHAVEFSTWRSLDQITGSDRKAVATVIGWLE